MSTIDISNVISELLEIAVHNILYTRKLYPKPIFAPKKKYNVIVHQSEHPLLNEYIAQCLKTAQCHMKSNNLKQFILFIKCEDLVIEKYVFDILQIQNKLDDRDLLLVKLEQDLRNFCLKLINSTGSFKPVPTNSEFYILLHTTEYSAAEFNEKQLNQDFPWISVENQEAEHMDILPLHTIDCDNLIMQVYIETRENK